jgi:hypothetical protein
MQNCPGWAMSGGPWITPDKAMRHLIWSRIDIDVDEEYPEDSNSPRQPLSLPTPQPSQEPWRDYRDVAVLAFPTPHDDKATYLIPASINSNRPQLPWAELLNAASRPESPADSKPVGKAKTRSRSKSITIDLTAQKTPAWVAVEFDHPTMIRSIELPPVERLMKRRNFDPDAKIRLEFYHRGKWHTVGSSPVPRGTWQDRQEEYPLVMAFADAMVVPTSDPNLTVNPSTNSRSNAQAPSWAPKKYRITFDSKHPMELTRLRLSSAARINDWRGQAGFALRSLQRKHRADPQRPLLQAASTQVKGNSIIDLSDLLDDKGQLQWQPTSGRWTVLRFGHVNTGVKNKPAPPEATGFECDKLSPAGAEQHFAGYIGRITQQGGPAENGQLDAMLIDSWECYTQTWTPLMESEFENRRHYRLRNWMPGLAGYVINDHLSTERFLRDWRKTISDLLVEHYFGRLSQLARERDLKLLFETAIGDVSPGDILEYYKSADVPMCEFWQPNDPHWGGRAAKAIFPTASAAHVYGKKIVAAEAFTNVGIRWDEHPFKLKHVADRHFTYGVNHLVFHTYTHNPRINIVPGTSFGNRIGTPFLRGQTWWKYMPLFTQYFGRCQTMLQQGQPVADVLFYLGDNVDHRPRHTESFPTGYRFDYLNQDALLNRIQVTQGTGLPNDNYYLTTPEGTAWRVIWLPPKHCQRLTPKTLQRLKQLIFAGATVVGPPPIGNATLSRSSTKTDDTFDQLVKEIWGGLDARSGDRSLGKGRLLWGTNKSTRQKLPAAPYADADKEKSSAVLKRHLLSIGLTPDVQGNRSATWCHRRSVDRDIYFLAADRTEPLDANLRFRSIGKPEFWDPMTGRITPVHCFLQTPTHSTLRCKLPAAGSIAIVFNHSPNASHQPSQRPVHTSTLTAIELDGHRWLDVFENVTLHPRSDPFPFGLSPGDELQPAVEPAEPSIEFRGPRSVVVWKNGTYRFINQIEGVEKTIQQTTIRDLKMTPIDGPWSLEFPARWSNEGTIRIGRLQPWNELTDEETRSFSGSATYRCTFDIPPAKALERRLLDLGDVRDIAEVTVNGHKLSTKWAPPFRWDVSQQTVAGKNQIEIKVTNTWHNRLVYDASLPTADRKTWTYHAPAKDKPLIPSGLIGPVTIQSGALITY